MLIVTMIESKNIIMISISGVEVNYGNCDSGDGGGGSDGQLQNWPLCVLTMIDPEL